MVIFILCAAVFFVNLNCQNCFLFDCFMCNNYHFRPTLYLRVGKRVLFDCFMCHMYTICTFPPTLYLRGGGIQYCTRLRFGQSTPKGAQLPEHLCENPRISHIKTRCTFVSDGSPDPRSDAPASVPDLIIETKGKRKIVRQLTRLSRVAHPQ